MPDKVAPLVPVPPVIVTVTLPTKPVSRLLAASRASTVKVVIEAPAVVVVGCVPNTRWLAVDAVISNELLVTFPAPAPPKSVALSVWPTCG